MPHDFEARLQAFAEVIVRVGLNLQRGQRLLIAEPYELQGVARSAEIIVAAVRAAVREAGSPQAAAVEVIWGDGPRLREYAAKADWRGFSKLTAANAATMDRHVRSGDALLFLQGSQPGLMDGIPAEQVAELRRIGWEHFSPIARQLVTGTTNWTVAPAPSPAWAHAVYADLPSEQRLPALWDVVFEACRVGPTPGTGPQNGLPVSGSPAANALAAWQVHLQALQSCRDSLNAQRLKLLHYQGEGTDLTLALPPEHLWCTAQLVTKSGLPFVANLPTEETFTAPGKDSAEGRLQIARPVSYGGSVIDGIALEFKGGRVVRAQARTGLDLLQRLLAIDAGACRLGEVALVPNRNALSASGRLYYHALLDENAGNHVALGQAYGFTSTDPGSALLNHSLIHVDLSIDAKPRRGGAEPP